MYKFVSFCLLTLGLLMHKGSSGQVKIDEPFCGKKWYCEMTKDGDGNTHPPEAGTEKDFMLFSCDNNFTLLEKGTNLAGKWTFDEETAIVTLTQTQIPTIPDKISFHFIEYDETHLVMLGQEGTKGESTVYFVTK